MVSVRHLILCRLGRYWKDPHSFKPSRFLEDWPRDAFMPFSAGEYRNLFGHYVDGFDGNRLFTGARACLGRKYGILISLLQVD